MALVLLAVVYGTSALTSRDPIWFVPASLDEPSTVTVYRAGTARQLAVGTPEHARVVAAVGDVVRNGEGAARAGLSEDTLNVLTRGAGAAVELRFDRPQRLGGGHARGQPTRLLVALEGPFAQDPFVFLGDDRGWWAEALVSSRVFDLRRALVSYPN